MAKKKKNQLPSGSIRIQVYDYTDVDGKKTLQVIHGSHTPGGQVSGRSMESRESRQETCPHNTLRGRRTIHRRQSGGSITEYDKRLSTNAGMPYKGYRENMA